MHKTPSGQLSKPPTKKSLANRTRRVPGAVRDERSPKREQLVASDANHCLGRKPLPRINPSQQGFFPPGNE